LYRTDVCAVCGKGEALLLIAGSSHHFMDHRNIQGMPRNARFLNQQIDRCPALIVQAKPDGVRLVTQDTAQELAGLNMAVGH